MFRFFSAYNWIFFSALWLTLFSCQSSPTNSGSPLTPAQANRAALADKYELIKKEKKQQSLLDLPFRGFDTEKTLTVIATGSCADQDQPQPIWKTIEKNSPDLFVFSGDTIYSSEPDTKPVASQFKKLNFIYEYRDARLKMPFMAVWDDHDYGQNDGGADNPEKEIYRTEFVKYWSYLNNVIPPKQKALYHTKIFGGKKNKVQVIMLDTRWDRSPLIKNSLDTYNPDKPELGTFPRPFLPNEDKAARILSEDQWTWLESELRKPADLRLLVSSIQVIANDHNFEKWGNFPKEREKLFSLLKKTKAKNLVILSGDRHMAAISKTENAGFPVYEMTSSGLNRESRPGGLIPDTTYIGEPYGPVNFGLIKINWEHRTVLLQVKSLEDEVKNFTEIKF